MSAFDRKIRRKATKKLAKHLKKHAGSIVEEALEAKMKSFSKVPDKCTYCNKDFDKKNREQVFSWVMQIYEEEDIYNLFCPECYQAKLKEFEYEE